MYIQRTIEASIEKLSNQFKVLLVTGVRQVGKTTLLKHLGKNRDYVTLDDYKERVMAVKEPELFLQRHEPPVIIDEIQYAPNLLSYIKIAVDNSEKRGMYWLAGSQKFHMMKNVTESLAGRVALINLMGFSLKEIDGLNQIPFLPTMDFIKNMRTSSKTHTLKDIYEIIWRGSYPEVAQSKNTSWKTFYSSYLQTYVERDIRALNTVKDEVAFSIFLKILASRTASMLNYSDISKKVGVSIPTIKSWISILVSSNIIYLLYPYYSNFGKRLVKTPKIYFLDTGLCSYLTDWQTPKVLETGAMDGAIFETFVVSQILKSYVHNCDIPNMYYYRDSDQKEIDLLIEQNGKLYPVEIKKTASPDSSSFKNFCYIPEDKRGEGALVCLSSTDYPITKTNNVIPVSYI